MISDEALITDCRLGRRAAQEALYARYAGRLLAMALRYVRTSFEAEDVLQEAFVKIFRSLGDYSGKGSFEGWLKRILVRTAINHYHQNQRLATEPLPDEDNLPNAGSTTQIIEQLSLAELMAVIQELPPGYRLVFNLYEIEGYSHPEIAELLSISEGTSKSQLFKAKEMLRRRLLRYQPISHV